MSDADFFLETYDYSYPEELIAHAPAEPRDSSRLLHVGNELVHRSFRDFPDILVSGDVVIINETRVLQAKLLGRRVYGGGAVTALIVRVTDDPCSAEVLAKPARRLPIGTELIFGDIPARVTAEAVMTFDRPVADVCAQIGTMPLPPYIHAPKNLDLTLAYQTIFARVPGSIAAPTASLHFSNDIFERMRERGVAIHRVVLDVGLGTFAPVRVHDLREHEMHEERYTIPAETAAAIHAAKRRGSRVIAIGTTVVRALESSAIDRENIHVGDGTTRLFISGDYRFRIVDAMLTNFHVPKSTLLVLVCAFGQRDRMLQAYRNAVAARYRLFSFGDAMFIER